MPDFKITRYRIQIKKRNHSLRQPFTAVFLSDLHNVTYGSKNCRLLQKIEEQKPRLILIAGDMLTETGREPEMDEALSLLEKLAEKYPVYYANGNHECRLKQGDAYAVSCYEAYRAKLRAYGIQVLENDSTLLDVDGSIIRIWGVEIPISCYRRRRSEKLTPEQMRFLLGEAELEHYHILLAHHPMYFDAYASWGADLTLSGHLHGGIVRLPLLGGVISPQVRLFPKYDRGLFEKDGRSLIVSGGLGSHTIPLRINNPPELVVIDFV